MVLLKMIPILILTLIGAMTAVPDDLLCCPPGSGTFWTDGDDHYCWDEKVNISSHVAVCKNESEWYNADDLNFTITHDGQVFLRLPGANLEVDKGTFCLANETVETGSSKQTVKLIVLCIDEVEHDNVALSYCMIVSVVFLSITTIIYAALPELRDLQGKSIINFCGSLAIGLSFLASLKLLSYSNLDLCAVRGFLVYFFLLASFFWTNAISIQILLSLRRPVVKDYGWKTFSWYALYAWGCPAVLTMCMAIVNYHPGDHSKPGIGLNHCWFFNKKQQWYYMYSVMTILIVANACIFIYISINLWRHSFSSSHIKALRYKFVMTLRMSIIMGLPWIFEMITSAAGPGIVQFILDTFNTLQGPLIFLVLVVFRKRVVKAMLKHGWLDCMAGPVERYLAVGDDDEEGVVQHTIDVTMDERNGI
ncbi:G-protein coupled receptor Mth2-like [Epargyreus clarus]|uniref:G-protein coupled receptor Mth2-like n=1 Tax=Epargyreus clarus TaxID=520877 RepID=UPI003C2F72D2